MPIPTIARDVTPAMVEFCMTMTRELPEFRNVELLREKLTAISHLAANHHYMAESACNRELTPAETRGQEACERMILRHALEIGCTGVVLSGDPRGCTVKLTVPSGYANDFGREGVCVPQ